MRRRYAVIAGVVVAMPLAAALADDAPKHSAAEAAASWAALDANSDGTLSQREVAGTPWQANFEAMDRKHDGRVTKQEYTAYVRARDSKQQGNDNM